MTNNAQSQFSEDDVKHFEAMVQHLFGVDVNTLAGSIGYLQQQQQESNVKPLREAWGDSFDRNFSEVEKYFQTLTPDQQDSFNNPEGLQYLFEKRIAPTLSPVEEGREVPTVDRGQTAAPVADTKAPTLTRADIESMSVEDRRARNTEILQAYASGALE